jgi:hypothetical protein
MAFPHGIQVLLSFSFHILSGMIHMIYSFMQLHPSFDGNSADSFQPYAPGVDSGQSSSKYSSKQGYYFLTYYPDFIKSKLTWGSSHKAQVVAMCKAPPVIPVNWTQWL